MSNFKTIDWADAKPGDYLVSDGGSVRWEIRDIAPGRLCAKDTRWEPVSGWVQLGYHVEREDPPKPKVARVLAHIGTAGILIGDALASAGFGPNDPIEILAVHEDLLAELEDAAREWLNWIEPYQDMSSTGRFAKALRDCGFGETP